MVGEEGGVKSEGTNTKTAWREAAPRHASLHKMPQNNPAVWANHRRWD